MTSSSEVSAMVPLDLENDSREAMVERVADEAHQIWANWMMYMFSQGFVDALGSWVMPSSKVERWQRQMKTPYAQLPDSERTSDRNIADRYLDLIVGPEEDTR